MQPVIKGKTDTKRNKFSCSRMRRIQQESRCTFARRCTVSHFDHVCGNLRNKSDQVMDRLRHPGVSKSRSKLIEGAIGRRISTAWSFGVVLFRSRERREWRHGADLTCVPVEFPVACSKISRLPGWRLPAS